MEMLFISLTLNRNVFFLLCSFQKVENSNHQNKLFLLTPQH